MIKDNILEVRRRIEAACLRAKRDPATVKLVAVSKNRSIDEIKEASEAGITEFGENRVQEALSKYESGLYVKWHMVGHLQTNKSRDAVKIFDLIHSVDSARLAKEIDKEALKLNKIQDVLLEVKISPEVTKSGIDPGEALKVFEEVQGLKNIRVLGFMGIAPLAAKQEEARPYFKVLKGIRDSVDAGMLLSMGMTDDFETAIEEGSNLIRIGRAIFEGAI